MTTILQLNASLFSGNGQSSRLTNDFVAALRAARTNVTVIERDLAANPVPHLDAERFGAFTAAPTARTPAQQAVVDFSDALVDELRRADVVVLGLPMYNFGVPSQLKAWFDHIARAGVTFRYGEQGPEGLLTGKKVIVFATRGGRYQGTPIDTQTKYIRDFFGFLGMTEVEFVYAEGLAISEESRSQAISGAQQALHGIAQALPLAA